MDTLTFAPLLRTLRLRYGADPHFLKLPWSQLTDCSVGYSGSSTHSSRAWKSWTKLIIWLHYRFVLQVLLYKKTRPIICLKSLRTLQVHMGYNYAALFDHILLPALTYLGYEDVYNVNGWPHADFLSLMSRSTCPLQTLSVHLTTSRLSDIELLECMSASPLLRKLSHTGKASEALTSAFFTQFARQAENKTYECLVPYLNTLFVSHSHELDVDAFVAMVESRSRLPTGVPT